VLETPVKPPGEAENVKKKILASILDLYRVVFGDQRLEFLFLSR